MKRTVHDPECDVIVKPPTMRKTKSGLSYPILPPCTCAARQRQRMRYATVSERGAPDGAVQISEGCYWTPPHHSNYSG